VYAADQPVLERPNIVYILADDLGYGDLKRFNPQSKIPTPHLDRLTAEGMAFTDAHTPSSVCTPTRYGLLTGRYCWRSRLKSGVLMGYSSPLIEPDRLTVPALLKRSGYSTACFGKWHLGLRWMTKYRTPFGNQAVPSAEPPDADQRVDFTQPIADGPTGRGFDSFFGIAASLDMAPYVFIENNRVVAQPTARQEKITVLDDYLREGWKDPAFQPDRVLPELTAKAVGYIAQRAAQTPRQPFFLYFPLNAPHTPIVPAEEFQGQSAVGKYGDYVMAVDATVGRIMRALDERGLSANTLLIFTSDNGPERNAYPRAEQYRHFSMGGLRGLKRDIWEGGHRVPFLARWPGMVAPGTTCEETICHTDLMATVAAILEVPLPADAGEDSANILPALLGQPLSGPIREATVHHTASGRFAIRQGKWVLIDTPTGDDNREPDWLKAERGYHPHHEPGELFDLSNDLSERENLYAARPEVVKRLKTLLEKYKREGRSVPAER
jgi:arylsulfatase A-like enzyme